MKVYRKSEDLPQSNGAAVTVGTFDGIHHGHRKIIEDLTAIAVQSKLESVLVTFYPNPKIVVNPNAGKNLKILTTIDERVYALKKTNIDKLLIIDFNEEFSRWSYDRFLNEILIEKLNVKELVVGYDHAFGKNREGNFSNLKTFAAQYNFGLHQVAPVELENKIVSSSEIRNLLQIGDVESANRLLGRNYSLTGIVERGIGRGHTIDFPTANIGVTDEHKLIPENGVYAVDVYYHDKMYKGMVNIGVKPTFGKSEKVSIEVNIFDFGKNIYNKKLTIYFKKRLRKEMKFERVDDLVEQLKLDKAKSLVL
jgi:riboflavin kinase/FMN adenylyltransferase